MITSFLPFMSHAEEDAKKPSTEKPKTTKPLVIPSSNNFCSKFGDISSKIAADISERELKKKENEINLLDKTLKKESDTENKKAKSRAEADSKRIKTANKLNAKAKTTIQKSAASEYTRMIDSAVMARRAAIDTATSAYQEGLKSIPAIKSTESEALFSTLKSSIESASVKASNDCTNKIPSKTVSTEFNKAIKDAKIKFNSDKNQLSQSSEIKALKEARDSAFKKAEAEFKNATDKARADLVISTR